MTNDTICALATPTGGALAVIRISGSRTFDILSAISSLSANVQANTIHYTHIVNADGKTIDEVLISIFRSPRSYTGEDSAEISCHGSSYIAKAILNLLVNAGCRLAQPGEFTQRAFLNGKMDLSQAEAVADLIASRNSASHQLAISQLKGHFSSELAALRDKLLHLTTLLELELDFSDHEELEFADRSEILDLAQKISQRVQRLTKSFEVGQAIKEGIPVAIVGKTNVGKSTLLNCLLHDERAIVSDIHGTTRDTIEDTIEIQGVCFRIIDTAGLRTTSDEIENIGIQRTYQAIDKARIVVWLIDKEPDEIEVKTMKEKCSGKSLIIVRNKADIITHEEKSIASINISAKLGENISMLEDAIYRETGIGEINPDEIIVTNTRHLEALIQAQDHLQRVLEAIQLGLSGDLIAEDLRLVLTSIGEITGGTITSQETLNNIFSHFCIGK